MDEEISAIVSGITKLSQQAKGFTISNISSSFPGLPTSVPVLFDHRDEGNGLNSLKRFLDEYRIHPERRTGTANVSTLQSLIDLTNRQKTEHSVIFAETSWPNPSLTTVLNYHEIDPKTGKPAFLDHRIHYPFPLTEEFKAWANQDGKRMSQHDFAVFIEDRVMEIANATDEEQKLYGNLLDMKFGTPADMILLARGLDIAVGSKVKMATRLSTGEHEVIFTEEHTETRDYKGDKVVVPGLIMVSVPAFLDSLPVRIPARLRYVKGEQVFWTYQLYRWKEILRERVVNDLSQARGLTKLQTFEGKPEGTSR